MAEPYRLEIIEAAQQRRASNEIVWHAKISLPAGGQHHRRKMCASRAAAYMNTRGIAAEIARVRVHPSDRRAALVNDFGERDERGKRVIHRYHTRAGPGEAFGHEAGIGAVEQAPIPAVKKYKNRRWFLGRRGKNVEPLRLARAVGNGELARQAGTHARALRGISR